MPLGRQIEAELATWQLVAVRYLTGETHPDHDTINAFREDTAEAIQDAFGQLLRTCQSDRLLCRFRSACLSTTGFATLLAAMGSLEQDTTAHSNRRGALYFCTVISETVARIPFDIRGVCRCVIFRGRALILTVDVLPKYG